MCLRWNSPVELSDKEQKIIKRCKAKKLFVFLRLHRHELFDEQFQQELQTMYGPQAPGGTDPVAPALLAMVTLMQAAFHVSDADAVEEAATGRRWQMVLNCLDVEEAPFSQGSLVNFRQRLIAHQMDRRLLERSVELARTLGGYDHRKLRVALDSSPLFGAGRVEDTFNLIGHAAKEVVRTAAQRLGVPMEPVAKQAGIEVTTASSVKAALDVDWDEPGARTQGLTQLLGQVENLCVWLAMELGEALDQSPLKEQVQTVGRIIEQDTQVEPEPDPPGPGAGSREIRYQLKEQVAKDRQICITDPQMRHGRKSRSSRVDGYKRHVGMDLETRLILSVAVEPANRPEEQAAPALVGDIQRQGFTLEELQCDRGYLSSSVIEELRQSGVLISCKAYPIRNGGLYTKEEFQIDLKSGQATCPQGVSIPIQVGKPAHFPAERCDGCPARSQCTEAKRGRGRSLVIHRQEEFHQELRARQGTAQGRAALRKRSRVEHRLAHVGRSQGRRARYLGVRKNLFDGRRHAIVANLHVANGLARQAAAAA